MRHSIYLLLVCSAVHGSSAPARAWWEDGRIIVSRIAESRLTKEAQSGIMDPHE